MAPFDAQDRKYCTCSVEHDLAILRDDVELYRGAMRVTCSLTAARRLRLAA
jgi:hypothetical protein